MKPRQFYVAETGDDTWSGAIPAANAQGTDGPFVTLDRARDVIRELRSAGKLAGAVQVHVHSGTYFIDAPFVLCPEDSGTTAAPVTYAAYRRGRPVIHGGKIISEWHHLGENLWQANVPALDGKPWFFRQLFVNGERYTRARIPATGTYYLVADMIAPDDVKDESNKKAFHCEPGQVRNRPDLEDIELVTLHRWDITRLKIAAIDAAKNIVQFAGHSFWPFRKGRRFFLENVREGLGEPHAWYLDAKKSVVFLRAKDGEDISQAEVYAPVARQLVRLEGRPESGEYVEHVTLKGLKFCYSDWELPPDGEPGYQAAINVPGALSAVGARNCAIEDCEIFSIGSYAIEFGRGCSNNRIAGNHIHDMGAGGVKLGETTYTTEKSLLTRNNDICDNRIHDGGKVMLGAVGILICQSGGNRIAHNEVYDLFYTGISLGWNWEFSPNNHSDNIVEYNHLHHLLRHALSDGGGIYTLGVSPGTILRNNLIHDIFAYEEGAGRGIYLDAGSIGIRVENNIVYRTSAAPMRLQIGTACNIMINNIFAFGKLFQLAFDTDRSNCFEKNIIYWNEGRLFSRESLESFDTVFDYNIYWNTESRDIRFFNYTFDEWRKVKGKGRGWFQPEGMDEHSLLADPLFVDARNGDFSLKPESPAFAIGFVPINMSEVGPRKNKS